jgi:hypothetical protein
MLPATATKPAVETSAPACTRRTCPGYVDVWLGDQRQRIWANLLAYPGNVFMVTITAPSIPWDPQYCTHATSVKCSGTLGCRVDAERARAFNLASARAHSSMHRAASEAVRRKQGSGALQRLAYAPELQARGVIHWHVVLGVATPREKAAAHQYVNELHRLAPSYGYGFVDRGRPVKWRGKTPVRFRLEERPAHRAAAYISKYLTKVAGESSLRELVVRQEAPQRSVYVANALTSKTRYTMRNLRIRRAIYVQWRVTLPPAQAEAIWQLQRVFDGELLEPVDEVPQAGLAPPATAA